MAWYKYHNPAFNVFYVFVHLIVETYSNQPIVCTTYAFDCDLDIPLI